MVKITVNDNGPLRIEGDGINLCDPSGRTVVSLCRCGHSANKPFCDGQHARQAFQSSCPARDLPPPKPKV